MRTIEEHVDELVAQLRFPLEHRKRTRSTNPLERTFVEVRRRTKIIGRFPGETSAVSLIWAVLETRQSRLARDHATPRAVAHIERLRRGHAPLPHRRSATDTEQGGGGVKHNSLTPPSYARAVSLEPGTRPRPRWPAATFDVEEQKVAAAGGQRLTAATTARLGVTAIASRRPMRLDGHTKEGSLRGPSVPPDPDAPYTSLQVDIDESWLASEFSWREGHDDEWFFDGRCPRCGHEVSKRFGPVIPRFEKERNAPETSAMRCNCTERHEGREGGRGCGAWWGLELEDA